MNNPISKVAEKYAKEKAGWIDNTIISGVPAWKLNLIKKYNYAFVKKLLNVNIEIINEDLIADFGTRVIIKLNNKVIGYRNFKY